MHKTEALLLACFAAFLVVPHTAAAYIDPGAGSMLLQILIGGFAGVFVIGRLFWRSILTTCKSTVSKLFPKSRYASNSEVAAIEGSDTAQVKD